MASFVWIIFQCYRRRPLRDTITDRFYEPPPLRFISLVPRGLGRKGGRRRGTAFKDCSLSRSHSLLIALLLALWKLAPPSPLNRTRIKTWMEIDCEQMTLPLLFYDIVKQSVSTFTSEVNHDNDNDVVQMKTDDDKVKTNEARQWSRRSRVHVAIFTICLPNKSPRGQSTTWEINTKVMECSQGME